MPDVNVTASGHPIHDPYPNNFANLPETLDQRVRKYKASKAFEIEPYVFAAVDAIGWSIAGVPFMFFEPANGSSENAIEAVNFGMNLRTSSESMTKHIKNEYKKKMFVLKKLIEQGKIKPVSREHDVYKLFNPPRRNYISSMSELKYLTYVSMCLWGEIFYVWEKEHGIPVNVKLRSYVQMVPILLDGELIGWGELDSRTGRVKDHFTNEDLLHVKFPNPFNLIRGLPPLKAARLTIEQKLNIDIANAGRFQDGAIQPPFTIELPKEIDMDAPQDRAYLATVARQYAVFRQGLGPMVLSGGAKANALFPVRDLDYLKGVDVTVEGIGAPLHVPPGIIGKTKSVNYSNMDKQYDIFWIVGNLPRMRLYEDIMNVNLLEPYWPSVRAVYDYSFIEVLKDDPIELADTDLKTSQTVGNYRNMKLSWKEIALVLDKPRYAQLDEPEVVDGAVVEGEILDEEIETISQPLFIQMDTLEVKEILEDGIWHIKVTQQFIEEYGKRYEKFILLPLADEWMKFIDSYIGSMTKRLLSSVKRGKAKTFAPLNPTEWSLMWPKLSLGLMTRIFYIAIDKANQEIKNPQKSLSSFMLVKEPTLSDILDEDELKELNLVIRQINQKTKFLTGTVDELNNITRGMIDEGASVGQIRDAIEKRAGIIVASDGVTVARTVTGAAYNSARFVAQQKLGAYKHAWSNSGDAAVREDHVKVNNVEVLFGDKFPIVNIRYPLDPRGKPEQIINCRCTSYTTAIRPTGQRPRLQPSTQMTEVAGIAPATWLKIASLLAMEKEFKKVFNILKLKLVNYKSEARALKEGNIIGADLARVKALYPALYDEFLSELEIIKQRPSKELVRRGQFEDDKISIFSYGIELDDTLTIGTNAATIGDDLASTTRTFYGDHIYRNMDPKFKDQWDALYRKHSTRWFEDNVSFYAASSSEDAFAEAFSAYTSKLYGTAGRGRKLPKDIQEFFENTIDKKLFSERQFAVFKEALDEGEIITVTQGDFDELDLAFQSIFYSKKQDLKMLLWDKDLSEFETGLVFKLFDGTRKDLSRLYDEFPGIQKLSLKGDELKIFEIVIGEIENRKIAGAYSDFFRKITLQWDRIEAEKIRLGSYTVAGDNPVATFRHELGHYLFKRTLSKTQVKKWNNFFKSKDKNWWWENCSVYSGSNANEAFAECFTMYTSSAYEEGLLDASIERLLKSFLL